MSEWWTYRLSDFLMFSPRTWDRLIELYNAAIWPIQLLAAAVGLLSIGLAFDAVLRRRPRERALLALLAPCWAWVAWAFHLERHADINLAADAYAAAFGMQALLLGWASLRSGDSRMQPASESGRPGWTATRRGCGLALLLLAIPGWPAVGALAGQPWARLELFGLMPDPTAVATLGVLLMLRGSPRSILLWPIPLAWCAVSSATLWTLDSPQALLPAAAGAVALAAGLPGAWTVVRRSRLAREHGEER